MYPPGNSKEKEKEIKQNQRCSVGRSKDLLSYLISLASQGLGQDRIIWTELLFIIACLYKVGFHQIASSQSMVLDLSIFYFVEI